MNRPIWTLPLSENTIVKLKKQGFKCCEDLIDLPDGTSHLKGFVETENEIREMLKCPQSKTASELDTNRDCIATFSKGIDDLLNGGVQLGQLTELTGAPGSGKSQICMQLCVAVQIPSCFEGLEAEAIYVDTNSNFSRHRLTEMMDAFLGHVSKVLSKPNEFKGANINLLKSLTTASMLDKIHRIKMNDLNHLYALYDVIEQHPKVKLIVVDSFVMPLYTVENSLKKNALVHNALDLLLGIAHKHGIAVVLTNDLTTVVNEKEAEVFPALGETFAHRVHYRLLLSKIPNIPNGYTALLKKSMEHERSAARFLISTEGVRDLQRIE
ncbi:DNA repair protein RAD51 homolog 3 [Adelges cooleyi]|uniref:DNA repair protein RAD51 homolog 3 n=1 Tax=Adelges cooleyi TaxID=133065 RepID=UPI002180644F|nr:DNA repair protein RAD51 homolog 3 [Adelges cooleyi]XP_050441391.1 DNA repair protein RAD51 homolog 3 [Adelges cooleyi]